MIIDIGIIVVLGIGGTRWKILIFLRTSVTGIDAGRIGGDVIGIGICRSSGRIEDVSVLILAF